MDVADVLAQELNNLPSDSIVYIETTPEKTLEVSNAIVKYFSSRNDKGVIVSGNRPYTTLMNLYRNNGIDVSKMFIIDCISKGLNGDNETRNVSYVENLSSLTDISLSLDEHINNSVSKKFIFFDSLTTMLLHNKPVILARFIHNILTKMRLSGVGGVIISLQDINNREVRAEIAQLCDKVIKI